MILTRISSRASNKKIFLLFQFIQCTHNVQDRYLKKLYIFSYYINNHNNNNGQKFNLITQISLIYMCILITLVIIM